MLQFEGHKCFIDKAFSLVLLHINEMFKYVENVSRLCPQQIYYNNLKDFSCAYLNKLMFYFVSIGGEKQLNDIELKNCTDFNTFLGYVSSFNGDKQYYNSIMKYFYRMLQQSSSPDNSIEEITNQDYLCMTPSSSVVESVFAILKRMKHQNMKEQLVYKRGTFRV